MVAYYIGDRSEESFAASCGSECRPEAYRGGHCYSDFFWKAYREVVPAEQHTETVGKESGERAHVVRGGTTL